MRKYIQHKEIALSEEAEKEYKKWLKNENASKGKANISFDIRLNSDKLLYLSMDDLANLADMHKQNQQAALSRDAISYKPIRDAMAHTSRLTKIAKNSLNTTYENIKARVKRLLDPEDPLA